MRLGRAGRGPSEAGAVRPEARPLAAAGPGAEAGRARRAGPGVETGEGVESRRRSSLG